MQSFGFDQLAGWEQDDHAAALACFRVTARQLAGSSASERLPGTVAPPASQALESVARRALQWDKSARSFFETWFKPNGPPPDTGFVTGYFEPEITASAVRTDRYAHPLHRKPNDLMAVTETNRPVDWDEELDHGRLAGNALIPLPDRAAIQAGALDGEDLELVWLADPIEAFFVHVQGSARLRMTDGSVRRVGYAGKNGHPYHAIGQWFIERNLIAREAMTMERLGEALRALGDRAHEVMATNPSYIFFEFKPDGQPDLGPVGAAQVPLTPGRSLAVDAGHHPWGTPVWIATHQPLPGLSRPWKRLMIAQDTGSAIRGPTRGDLFIGSGKEAGLVAGAVRHACDFIALAPLAEPGGKP